MSLLAAQAGHAKIVQTPLECGADLKKTTRSGRTALVLAALAKRNLKIKSGLTAPGLASIRHRDDIIKLVSPPVAENKPQRKGLFRNWFG
jgi:ankyrin repeat protein